MGNLLAVIADVHANTAALDAVVADASAHGARRFICLGDIASLGPRPAEAVQCISQLAEMTVKGNHDHLLLHTDMLDRTAELPRHRQRIVDMVTWCAQRLSARDRQYLGSLPLLHSLDLEGGASLLCCHGSPRAFDDFISPETPEEELDRLLEGVEAAVVAAAHTHNPMIRRFKNLIILNPGSVGLASRVWPASGRRPQTAPWAEYALLQSEGGTLGVQLRRIPYDTRALLDHVRQQDMPHAEWFASTYR